MTWGNTCMNKKAADKALNFEGGDIRFAVNIIASMLTQAKHIEQNAAFFYKERYKYQ